MLRAKACLAMTVVVLLGIPAGLLAATPGNLIFSSNNKLFEYTRAGSFVGSTDVPWPGTGEIPYARDLIVGLDGDIHVFNGTLRPYVSTRDSATNAWSHRSFSGWSMANVLDYGGIAIHDRYIFVPDMRTGPTSVEEQGGVVRFDLLGGPTIRFGQELNPFDVSVCLDGLLYVLRSGGFRVQICVYNPETLDLIRELDTYGWLSGPMNTFNGIAADADGSIFLTSTYLTALHISANGDLISTLDLPPVLYGTTDIDLASDGTILIGGWDGHAVITDRNFSSTSLMDTGTDAMVFTAFVVPEPSTLALATAALIALAVARFARQK